MTKRQPEQKFPVGQHPENIPSDEVSLFDMHEDMQTVDTISLADQREDLQKEAINHREEKR